MNQKDDLMLPPLPESVGVHQWLPTFTSEQMREYAKKAVETERAKRRPLTHEQRQVIEKANTTEGYHGDYYDAYGIMDDVEAFHGIITLD